GAARFKITPGEKFRVVLPPVKRRAGARMALIAIGEHHQRPIRMRPPGPGNYAHGAPPQEHCGLGTIEVLVDNSQRLTLNMEKHMPRFTVATLAALVTISVAFAFPATAQVRGKTPPALAKKISKPVSPDLVATLKKASEAGL